ncbi:MAG: chemotaxis protein CheW [Mariprofundus sp.]
MLLLCFSLGDERFAMDASMVQEVVPRVQLKKLPETPAWVAGVICYHGQAVPVIDLCALHIHRNASDYLSTRMILVHFIASDQTEHLLGLLAEKVIETGRFEQKDIQPTGVETPNALDLGGIIHDRKGMLQWVDVDKLLPEPVQDLLFQHQQGESS